MKKNIILYVAITLLACALTGTITYILVDKKDNKNEIKENNNNQNNNEENNNQNEEPIKEDGVKLLKTYNLNDKIIEEFEITLNGKIKKINVNFTYENETPKSCYVLGEFNNIPFLDNEYYDENNLKEDYHSIKSIKNIFNEENFQIIKGTDNKNYLLVIAPGTTFNFLYVYNDDLELLTKNLINSYNATADEYYQGFVISSFVNYVSKVENANPWYSDLKQINKENAEHINVKIENNKIYFLASILDKEILEEREYTIDNNKLEYKTIKEYRILETANAIY